MRHTSQRREFILKLLMDKGSAQVAELAEQLEVSPVTIRHDLQAFEKQGLVVRQYGGAFLRPQSHPEVDIRQRDTLFPSLKARIGARAAQLVRPGENILIDAGTTTHQMAARLKDMSALTVMTNSLNVCHELAQAPGVELLVTGGHLRRQSLSFQGDQAEASLMGYNFDKLFLGVDGFDLRFGITTHSEREASLNRRMIETARHTIVLTDSSKFGRVSLHRIAPANRVQTVVTDSGIDSHYREAFAEMGIELITVD
jgi:DeoR family transcriptional regulator of aga operon